MNIVTKYDIGHTFWVPRVRKQIQQEELVWEGETWYKDVETYVPLVKLKKIVFIEIKVGRQVGIVYGVKNVDDENTLSSYYPEANITNYTEEEAMAIAEEYAEQNQEYFGNWSGLVQLVEQRTLNPLVGGSSPSPRTNIMEHVMKRHALDYARETVKMYSDKSILNPYNRYTVGNPISGNDRLKWNDHLENIKIIT